MERGREFIINNESLITKKKKNTTKKWDEQKIRKKRGKTHLTAPDGRTATVWPTTRGQRIATRPMIDQGRRGLRERAIQAQSGEEGDGEGGFTSSYPG